ncbi:NC domain-containing protein [Pseudomonas sp. GM78]|nr:NC domain-containing protein [Pseudomonas sp. GM78]
MNTVSGSSHGRYPDALWHDDDWSSLIDVAPGSHLITARNGYVHHGIYLGERQVIHYAGMCGGFETGPIEIIQLTGFANGRQVRVRRQMQPGFKPERVLQRALSRVGERRYRLLTNNCEHFCYWSLFGKSESPQVREVLSHPSTAMKWVVQYWPMVAPIYLPVLRSFFRAQLDICSFAHLRATSDNWIRALCNAFSRSSVAANCVGCALTNSGF